MNFSYILKGILPHRTETEYNNIITNRKTASNIYEYNNAYKYGMNAVIIFMFILLIIVCIMLIKNSRLIIGIILLLLTLVIACCYWFYWKYDIINFLEN